jgi:RNA polymerase primary sigma factor
VRVGSSCAQQLARQDGRSLERNLGTAENDPLRQEKPTMTAVRSIFPAPAATASGSGGASASARPLGPASDDSSTLSRYFREMATEPLMGAAEEEAAAMRIRELRRVYWQALLGYPPFVPAILDVASRKLPADIAPAEAIARLRIASRKVRDRHTRANQTGYATAVAKLAEVLGVIDTDGLASDPVLRDLRAIVAGRSRSIELDVVLPRQASAPFWRYAAEVETAAGALADAKHGFVRANLRLVVTMARRYHHGKMTLPDLIQEGNLGLLKAVDRFDPTRGYRFSTYASWWIRHAISRALADKGREVRVPVHMLDVHHKLKRERQRFAVVEGREPGDEELAARTAVPVDRIRRLRLCLLEDGASLDSPISGGDARTAGEMLEDDSIPSAVDAMQSDAMGEHVRSALERLTPIEADVLRKRFGLDEVEPMTLREIGAEYSLSRERIRQLQEQALGKIRRELRRKEVI